MKCRFIDAGANDAYTNMAIDEALLINSKIPILRVYSWNPKAVSVGYNQNLEKEINIDECKKLNIDIVRRITGGKAVFHDKEITYSFILPENNGLLPFEVNESYKIIANALVIALKKININAEIKKVPEKIATSICFNSSNWYELLVNGRKISGSAQRRMDGKILQHGPILIDFDYNKNNSLFNSNNLIDNIINLKNRITSLKNEINNKIISYKELSEAIKSGFKENFNFEIIDDSLTNEETRLAEKLVKEKYSTEEWNYRLLAKTI
jgi:lipoate-protein ligase A